MAKRNRQVLIGLLILAFICWPLGIGIGWSMAERITDSQLDMILGGTAVFVTFAVTVLCLALFARANSTNRRKEEHEDDTREMQLIDLMGRLMGNQTQAYRPYMQQPYFPVQAPPLEELEPGGRVEFE